MYQSLVIRSRVPVPCDPKRIRDLSPDPFLFILTDEKGGSPARGGPLFIFFYLTRPLLLGEAPPLPRLPLLRRGSQPVNRLFCTRKQALAHKGLLVNCLRNRVAIVLRNRIAIILRNRVAIILRNRVAIVLRNRIAIVWRTMCECLCAEGADAQVSDYWLLMKKMGKSLVVWEIIRIFAAWIR